MAALTDISDIINRLTGGNSGTPDHKWFWKDNRVGASAATAAVAHRLLSLWTYNGCPGAPVLGPGAVAAPDNTTNGSLKQADPGGGRQKWLLGMSAAANTAGTLILYDRLLHISGLNGTTITAQTVGGSLTRYTGAESAGNQIWIEIYTAIGSTGTTITANYTDQSGNSGQTTEAAIIGGTGYSEAQRFIPLQLADGDTGVQAVASVTLAASTLTAGNFGVTVVRPLATLSIGGIGYGNIVDSISKITGIPEIKAGACLAFAFMPNSTTSPQILGSIHTIEK